MKVLILFIFLIGADFIYSQDLTDTIYYKSGIVRAGIIYKENKHSIKYKYRNDNGKIRKTLVRKMFLNCYTVGDKQNSVASNYTSQSPESEIQRKARKEKGEIENTLIFAGGTMLVIVGALAASLHFYNPYFW
jgi:hypothetical protein